MVPLEKSISAQRRDVGICVSENPTPEKYFHPELIPMIVDRNRRALEPEFLLCVAFTMTGSVC